LVSSPILVAHNPQSADPGPVEFALAAARFTEAPLVVATVAPGGSMFERLSGGEFSGHGGGRDEDALGRLRASLAASDVPAELRVVEHSTPARGIAAAVEELKPRLLVVGSTHRGTVGRVLPGSTAERLIHGSPCAVAVVPHGYETRARAVRTVGAAFLPTAEGRGALRVAAELARSAGARLLAVLVLSPKHAEEQAPGLMAASKHDQDVSENRYVRERLVAQDGLDAALAAVADDLETEPDILFQAPADGLVAASHRTDLLVVGSRAYGPMHAVMLGGVAHRVTAEAACPVLVVPRGVDTLIGGSPLASTARVGS
jgi:nucleotide-binding universal stress UspA family protein